MAQIWAAASAAHYEIPGVASYSGGTEATAFHPNAVDAIRRAGFVVDDPGGENPRYEVRFSEATAPVHCFSKVYDDPANPQKDFAAVMTCSQADAACPVVHGAALRVPITYEDPKAADGSPEEPAVYDERCRQIGREMLYLMSRVRR